MARYNLKYIKKVKCDGRTDGPMDQRTNKAGCRVACTQLITLNCLPDQMDALIAAVAELTNAVKSLQLDTRSQVKIRLRGAGEIGSSNK